MELVIRDSHDPSAGSAFFEILDHAPGSDARSPLHHVDQYPSSVLANTE